MIVGIPGLIATGQSVLPVEELSRGRELGSPEDGRLGPSPPDLLVVFLTFRDG
jgi:hypothetical protein